MRHVSFVAIALLVIVAPVSAAGAPFRIEATLELPRFPFLSGAADVGAAEGALDLTEAVRAGHPITLRIDGGSGRLVTSSWSTTPGGMRLRDGSTADPVHLPPGELQVLECSARCRVLVVADGGRLGFRGDVDGRLPWRMEPDRFCADFCNHDDPREYRYDSPAGAFLLGEGGLPWDGVVTAEGRVQVLLDGVLARHVDGQGRAEHLNTREEEARLRLPAGDFVQTRSRFLHLTADAVSLEAPGAGVRMMTSTLDLHLEGGFAASDVRGVVVAGAPQRLDSEPLRMRGTFDARFVGDGSGGPLARERAADATLAGEATDLEMAARTVRPVAAEPSVQATFALALLALALVGLYSRIRRDRIFDNANRARIADLLRSRPGLTSREIAAALDLARVVVQHHLVILLAHRFVMRQRVGRADRYHVVDVPLDRAALERERALRDPTRRRIAELVASRAGVTQSDVAAALGVSQRLVSYHLRRLESTGLVRSEGQSPRRYAACGDLPGPRAKEE